jgi:hypothetical protein
VSASFNDAAGALVGAIRVAFAGAGRFTLEELVSRAWASVTFSGSRQELAFRIEGETADAAAAKFLSGLRAAEFPLAGHILADIALVSEERRPGYARIRLEALTVEDGWL